MTSLTPKNADLGVLDPNLNIGYLPKPIPQPRDHEIEDILAQHMACGSFARLCHSISRGNARVLHAFAERMATAAIRNNSPGQLNFGLIALLLGQAASDSRDGLTVFPLFLDAMTKLRLDPHEIAESVRQAIGDRLTAPLVEFMKRSDKSLQSMGYSEGADDDGFRYIRNW